jgi:TatD DNase family protein
VPFFDAHNHLQDERLGPELDEVVPSCRRLGIEAMVVNGTCETDWPRVEQLAARYPFVIPAYGIHPWRVGERSPDWKDHLLRRLEHAPVAMGEIGLDRWMRNPDFAAQEEVFRMQLRIAAERDLPVTIHCLKAWGWLLEILQSEALPARGFLLHSYSGSAEMIPRLAEMGALFSLSGYFAHPRKAAQREAFRQVPRDRLLLETDAPDMGPPNPDHALRDSGINHPANIAQVYRFAAGLLAMDPTELNSLIEANFRRFFSDAFGRVSGLASLVELV